MSLGGRYAEDAKKSYKTVEGRELLAAVREAIRLIDEEMDKPSSRERGMSISIIVGALEFAADRYDLFGEKDRRRKLAQRQQREAGADGNPETSAPAKEGA